MLATNLSNQVKCASHSGAFIILFILILCLRPGMQSRQGVSLAAFQNIDKQVKEARVVTSVKRVDVLALQYHKVCFFAYRSFWILTFGF